MKPPTDCKEIFEKLCAHCEKDEDCIAKCKETHDAELEVACEGHGGKQGEWMEGKLEGHLEKLGDMAEHALNHVIGRDHEHEEEVHGTGTMPGFELDEPDRSEWMENGERGMPGEMAVGAMQRMMGAMMGKRGEKDGDCVAALNKMCGQCEKEKQGRACWAKCKEEHGAELEAACEEHGEKGERMESMHDERGDWMKGKLEKLGDMAEHALNHVVGRDHDHEDEERERGSACEAALMEMCAECNGVDLFGKKDSGCWARCLAEHVLELTVVCEHKRAQMVWDEKDDVEFHAECEAAVTKLCGQCENEKAGRMCWAKCKREHKLELAAACEKREKWPVGWPQEEEAVDGATVRVLAASAAQASRPSAEAAETDGGSPTLAIIVGACVVVALAAVVAGVAMTRRRQRPSASTSQRSALPVLADPAPPSPVFAVPVHAAELSELKSVSVVVDAQPVLKADV